MLVVSAAMMLLPSAAPAQEQSCSEISQSERSKWLECYEARATEYDLTSACMTIVVYRYFLSPPGPGEVQLSDLVPQCNKHPDPSTCEYARGSLDKPLAARLKCGGR
jgi:hypothetical protein